MKKIIQHYGADLDWVRPLAEQLNGKIEGNFITVPNEIHTGDRYFFDCGGGIIALYVDVTYNNDFKIIQKNLKNDFIGLYYNLSDSGTELLFDTVSHQMGAWSYNLSLIDSSLEFEFNIKKGSKVFIFAIFIKKELIKLYGKENNINSKTIEKVMDPTKNTFIKWDRMSNKSFHAITDLRKLETGGILFNLNLVGTVHLLISEYLLKITNENIIIHLVNKTDLSNIISAQRYLIENIENQFPSIKYIASKFNMSETKFKSLFTKITGITANAFYIDNKLIRAKDLLKENELSISEVSKQLNFSDTAYFAARFKKKFGILPKAYSKKL